MGNKDSSTSVFPTVSANFTDEFCDAGMTKREYFAAMALQGLLSNSGGPVQGSHMSGWYFCNCTESDVADVSVRMADALLAALER